MSGDTSDHGTLGRRLRESDPAKAAEHFRIAADEGDLESASSLGYMYMTGEGVDTDRSLSERYLIQAAEGGILSAMTNLGFLLSSEKPEESFKWFSVAADKGSVTAMKNLSAMYSEGRGVGADAGEARKWLEKAADFGDVDSLCVLASMYRNGSGAEKDCRKAAEYYRKALALGYMEACYDLAFMLENGEGVPRD
ncbi:MAG: sel1 repeat family protein, partial [Candidatus Methanomethylophilaceae archaeon]|nr:sel1 repeat family protein [Candidatus Methanomethylophilaceae archaeon]